MLLRLVDQRAGAQAALLLARLLREDVALVGLVALHLAGAGEAEALLGAAVGLHLGHRSCSCTGLFATCAGAAVRPESWVWPAARQVQAPRAAAPGPPGAGSRRPEPLRQTARRTERRGHR